MGRVSVALSFAGGSGSLLLGFDACGAANDGILRTFSEPSNVHPPRCPKCGATSSSLLEGSRSAAANYFRCDQCHHVWTVPRSDDDEQSRSITTPAKADLKPSDRRRESA